MPATQTLLPVIGISLIYSRAKSLPITRFTVQLNLGNTAVNSTVGPNYVVGYRIQSAAGKVVKEYDSSELSVDKTRINFQFTDSCGYQDLLSRGGDDANFMGPYKISFIEILDKAQVSYDSANFSLSGTIPLIYKTYTLPYIINDGSYVTDLPLTTQVGNSSGLDIFPLYSWNDVKQLTIDGLTRNSIYADVNLSYELGMSSSDMVSFNFAVGIPTGKPGKWGLPGFTSPYSSYMYYGTRTTSFTRGELYTSDYLKIPEFSIGSDFFKADPTLNDISSGWTPTSNFLSDIPYTNPTTYKFDSSGIANIQTLIPVTGFTIPKNWAGYLTFKLIGGGGSSVDKTLFGWPGESVSTPISSDGTPSLDYKGIFVSGGDRLDITYDSTWGTDTILYVTKGGASSTRTAYRARAGGTSISKTQPNAGATPDGEKISGLAYNSVDPTLRRLNRDMNYFYYYYYGSGWDPTTVAAYSETRIHDINYTIPKTNSSEYSSRAGYYLITLTPDLELSRQVVTQSTVTWAPISSTSISFPSPNSLTKPAGAQWVTLPYTPSTRNIIRLNLRFFIANVDLDKSYFYTNVLDYSLFQSNNTFANMNPVRSSNSFKFKLSYSDYTASIGSVLTNTYTNTSGGIYYNNMKSLTSYDPLAIQTVTIEGVTPEKTLIVGNNPYNMLYTQFPLSFDLLAMGGLYTQNRVRVMVDTGTYVYGTNGQKLGLYKNKEKDEITIYNARKGEQLTSTSAINILVSPGDIIKYAIGDPVKRENSYIKVIRNNNEVYTFIAHSGATATSIGNDVTYYYDTGRNLYSIVYADPTQTTLRPISFIDLTWFTSNPLPGIHYVSGELTTYKTPQQGYLTFSIDYTIPIVTTPSTLSPLPPVPAVTAPPPLSLDPNIVYKIYESSVGESTTFTIPQFLSDNKTVPTQLSYKLIGGGGPGGYYTWKSGPMEEYFPADMRSSNMRIVDTQTGGQGGEYCQGTIPVWPGDEVTIVAGKGGYYMLDDYHNDSTYVPGNPYTSTDRVYSGNSSFTCLSGKTTANPLEGNGADWLQGKRLGNGLVYYTPVILFQVYGQDSYIKVVSQKKKRTSVVYARGGNNTEPITYKGPDIFSTIDYSTVIGNNKTPGGQTNNGTGAPPSLPPGFTPTSGITTYGGGGNLGTNNSFYSGMVVNYTDYNLALRYKYVSGTLSRNDAPDTAFMFNIYRDQVPNNPSQYTIRFKTFKDSSSGGNGYYNVKII